MSATARQIAREVPVPARPPRAGPRQEDVDLAAAALVLERADPTNPLVAFMRRRPRVRSCMRRLAFQAYVEGNLILCDSTTELVHEAARKLRICRRTAWKWWAGTLLHPVGDSCSRRVSKVGTKEVAHGIEHQR